MAGLVSWLVISGPVAAHARQTDQWRRVTFDGVSLRVPASWPVIRFSADPTACPRLDVHAVYLGTPGRNPVCPPGLVGRSVAVMVQPISAADGLSSVHRAIVDVLARAGVRVTISYRAGRSLAEAIRASIRATSAGRRLATGRRHSGHQAGPALAGQGGYAGGGFDSCAAPSAATMTSWLASSFRAVGIYIGGVNRACAQANLSASWLAGIVSQGWHYFPIYPGLQSSCVLASGDATITTSRAAAEGTAAADDAASQAASLGIPRQTPLSFDMEAYAPACDSQVLSFLSAWDSELHARGYLAGVYESFTNVKALAGAAGQITEPDLIYYADWDGVATTMSPYMPPDLWTSHQRIHQYRGGHFETHGGVTVNIDSDQLDISQGGTPPPPPPPGNAGFHASVAVNANGTAEWFATSARGTLTHSWQHPAGSLTWSRMHTVGRSPGSITTNPSAVAQADGALTVFAGNAAGQIVHAWQQAGFPNDWEWGGPLPALPVPPLAGTDPAALLLPRGEVAVYQTTQGGAVLVTAQRRPNRNKNWIVWGDIGGSCASSPAPIVDGAGKVDVFCVTTAGTMAMIRWNGHAWGSWNVLTGSPENLTGVPSAVVDGAGQTELFAATAAGGLAGAWQARGSSTWTWASLPAPGLGTGQRPGIAGSVSAATWPRGRVVIYAALSNGRLGYLRQLGTAGSSPWAGWASLGGVPGNAITGSPAGWLNTSGAASAAVQDGTHHLVITSNAGQGWSAWAVAGAGF